MDNGACSYRRFLDGNDEGLEEIIAEYKNGLMLFLNSYVGNIRIAEELTEDTFFRLAVKKPRFGGKSSFKSWLYSIGRNIAVDSVRRGVKENAVSVEELGEIESDTVSVEDAYIKGERNRELHKALSELSPEYRRVLLLVYFENCSPGDVAAIIGKSPRQTANLLYRAKLSLKKKLTEEGSDFEDR